MTGKKTNKKDENPYKPSAPYSTGTIPRHGKKPPGVDFEGLFELDSTAPSAPPLEQMDQVAGYENVSFHAVGIPPPPAAGELRQEECSNRMSLPAHPQVTELKARKALLTHIKKHWCYKESVARDMAITSIKYSSAFHYELQTFTEKRETYWTFVPYIGGEVDGAENGPAPLPWDIFAQPGNFFEDGETFIQVPHTSSVKQCHQCRGSGQVRCTLCNGKGWVHCQMCNGNPYRTRIERTDRSDSCILCSSSRHGRGRRDCGKCHTNGKLACSTCEGYGKILCFIRLAVIWKVNTSEHISEDMTLPEEFIRGLSGQVAYEEEGSHVSSLQGFPDETINLASAQIVHEHLRMYGDHRIIAQRQQVRVIPITSLLYEWKGRSGEFFVCGYENKVHAPNYPKTCCCCCSIL